VVVARHDARGLAEREGLAGIRRALGELIGKAAGSGDAGSREAVSAGPSPAEGPSVSGGASVSRGSSGWAPGGPSG
jgi:hypothetical protein